MEGILHRLHIAQPKYVDKNRVPCIPESVLKKRLAATEKAERKRKLEREIEEEMGDDYMLDLKKNYDIEGDQKYDNIPEIWEGHNIADYIDPEIFEVSYKSYFVKSLFSIWFIDPFYFYHIFNVFQKLNKLEQEEHLREEAGMYDYKVVELSETMREIAQLAKQIRDKKIIIKEEARVMKASTKPIMPRTAGAKVRDRSVAKLKEQMEDLGVDMEDTKNVSVMQDRYLDINISI